VSNQFYKDKDIF